VHESQVKIAGNTTSILGEIEHFDKNGVTINFSIFDEEGLKMGRIYLPKIWLYENDNIMESRIIPKKIINTNIIVPIDNKNYEQKVQKIENINLDEKEKQMLKDKIKPIILSNMNEIMNYKLKPLLEEKSIKLVEKWTNKINSPKNQLEGIIKLQTHSFNNIVIFISKNFQNR